MRSLLSRRQLLLWSPLLLFAPGLTGAEAVSRSTGTYHVDVAVLFGLLTFSVNGTVVQEIDRPAGQYRVTMAGQGLGATHRTESVGIIRGGRFLPDETRSLHVVRGRENRVTVTYDREHGVIEYHSLGYTLLLGRRRQVDDVIPLPPGQLVDDLISASLNFAANKLETEPDGTYRTAIVRRTRLDNEGPDDVSASGYHAEIVPVRFHVAPDAATGRLSGLIDLTPVLTWARPGQPARITFDRARQLESVESSLILGSTVTVRLSPAP